MVRHCESSTETPALLIALSHGNLQAKELQQLEELHILELCIYL